MDDKRQGIVHIIGPEQGFTQPGNIIVCGDSHTATHGAFGALAFGIGTSEVEHVLATQTLVQKKSKNFRISVNGSLPIGVTSKDVILQIIGKIGTAGGTGYVIEYAGNLISDLSVEQRMTICNMTIEGGARAGLIQPDEKIFKYLKGKPMSPKGENWDKALEYWHTLKSDKDANFDKELTLDGSQIKPMVTWGTSPQDVVEIDGKVPSPDSELCHLFQPHLVEMFPKLPLVLFESHLMLTLCQNLHLYQTLMCANILRLYPSFLLLVTLVFLLNT